MLNKIKNLFAKKPETKTEPEVKKVKEPKPKKEQVIIEQSSDDDDVFEDKPNVIFVKRVRGKNKVAPQPPNFHQLQQAPQQQVQQQQAQYQQRVTQQQPIPQYQPPPPPKPQLTPEKRLELERYMNMSRGNFLPMSRPK